MENGNKALQVTFKSAGRSGRVFNATFDLGSDDANKMAALRMCWTHNAYILSAVGA